MEKLSGSVDLEAFFEGLGRSRRSVLFLDYDGTLAPFRADPAQAVPYPGVAGILEELAGVPGHELILVTGRKLDDLFPLLPLARRLEVWGSHGWEHHPPHGGPRRNPEPDPEADRLLAAASRHLESLGLADQAEWKIGSLAFHRRSLPAAKKAALDLVARGWLPLARPGLLELREFDGGLELRAAGHDKGRVVEEVLAPLPSGTPAAYLGDDLTDEDAFRALAGRGLRILVRPERRKTEADYWIRPPEELIELLQRWSRATRAGTKVAGW